MMTLDRRRTLVLSLLIASVAIKAHGQAEPTATADALYPGFQLPDLEGSLHFALSASQRVSTNYNGTGQTVGSTSIAGDLGYLSRSEVHPFSMIYSGGYLGNTGDATGQPSSVFQNLALSQVFQTRQFHFIVADAVSYLPTAPTTGLSGIPGIGDLGITAVQVGPVSGQGILTSYAPRVNNNASATVQRNLTGSTTVEGSGSFLIQRFVEGQDANGIDNNQSTGIGGVTHRIDARNTISANYTYSRFTYPSVSFSFTSQSANLEYIRQVNRRILVDVTLGPQRTAGSAGITSSLSLAVQANATYTGELSTLGLVFSRGTNSGSGVVQGAQINNLSANVTRKLGRDWNAAALIGYTHTASLPGLSAQPLLTDIEVASFQANRKIGNYLSAFVSYSLQNQSAQGFATVVNVQNGISHIVGVGLTYSPSLIHLGHQ
ncbi:hypothetical protein [Granulicella sibirica]|uniref:Uncharacterized protein n=1 Tax=Granulicella sibirica TaxID=2479048 RepID=A0A4Q0SX96_9BACT|nr:hypothetical protein [Granulicella sibirica]RXH54590.1 hypothetical protein GRAN_3694 [Granulicella sibirica]